MTPMLLLYTISLLAACGVGAFLFFKAAGSTPDRFVLAGTPIFAVLLLTNIMATAEVARLVDWSNARLAPASALSLGYRLYYPESTGPVLNHIYTPVSALIYYPATLVSDPDKALTIAALMATLLFTIPLAFVVVPPLRRTSTRPLCDGLMLLFCMLVAARFIPSLLNVMRSVHADAPALFFAGVACVFVLRAARRMKLRRSLSLDLFLAYLFATLSFWSKQTMVPCVVAIPVWIFCAFGLRCAVKAAVWLFLMSLTALFLVSWHVSLDTFFFNIVEIPLRHPWSGDSHWDALKELLRLEQSIAWLCLIPVLAAAVWVTRRRTPCGWQVRRFFRENPWTLFVLAGLFTFPTCVLASVKVGGFVNDFAPAAYLFLLANAWILSRSWAVRRPLAIGHCGRITATVFALVLAFVLAQDLAGRFLHKRRPSNTEVAFNYISSHPNTAYFPWHPLAHVMAEKRLCHFDYGLYDRHLAGHGLDQAHLLAGIPDGAKLLCLPPGHVPLEYESGLSVIFPHRVEIEGLPGWECYERQH